MGVIIILIIAGVYILAYLRAFLFTRLTRSSNEISIPRYELLRFYSKVFRIVSLGVLAIVLGVHAVVYFGSFWAEQMFGFLLWIQPDPDSEDDSYLMQVGVIIFWTLLPYAKYSFGIVKTFKKQLFKYLQEKYKTNFEIIDSKLFFKKLQKTNIAHYALTDNNFRKLVIKNKSDANRRYGSDVSLDDVLYFPDKRMYITECDVQGYQEIYTQDNDGDWHWEKVIQKRSAFSGFIIIIDKDLSNDHIYQKLKEDTNLSNGAVNFYKVNNNKVLVKSKRGRSKKKHGSIFISIILKTRLLLY